MVEAAHKTSGATRRGLRLPSGHGRGRKGASIDCVVSLTLQDGEKSGSGIQTEVYVHISYEQHTCDPETRARETAATTRSG